MKSKDGSWTLNELCDHVDRALAVGYPGQTNGQIREVPDARSIRYYTTLGLIDRPGEMRGRTAFYGKRHLLQIVAIKRLQSRGLSLAEIQKMLVGISARDLSRLARLPEDLERALEVEETGPSPPHAETRDRRDRSAFWKEEPALASRPGTEALDSTEIPAPVLQAVQLSGEVNLLFPMKRPVSGQDVKAIQAAAVPLLNILETRGLLRRK